MRRLRVFTVGIVLASCSRLTSPAPLPAELSTISNGTPLSVSHSYKRLYSFHLAPPPDGLWPTTGLTYFRGLLYGTTYGGGGTASGPCKAGCGTVFSIGTSGTDERMVYKFAGAPDGAIPEAGLSDIDGALYGTTFYGGVTRCTGRGCGNRIQDRRVRARECDLLLQRRRRRCESGGGAHRCKRHNLRYDDERLEWQGVRGSANRAWDRLWDCLRTDAVRIELYRKRVARVYAAPWRE